MVRRLKAGEFHHYKPDGELPVDHIVTSRRTDDGRYEHWGRVSPNGMKLYWTVCGIYIPRPEPYEFHLTPSQPVCVLCQMTADEPQAQRAAEKTTA